MKRNSNKAPIRNQSLADSNSAETKDKVCIQCLIVKYRDHLIGVLSPNQILSDKERISIIITADNCAYQRHIIRDCTNTGNILNNIARILRSKYDQARIIFYEACLQADEAFLSRRINDLELFVQEDTENTGRVTSCGELNILQRFSIFKNRLCNH